MRVVRQRQTVGADVDRPPARDGSDGLSDGARRQRGTAMKKANTVARPGIREPQHSGTDVGRGVDIGPHQLLIPGQRREHVAGACEFTGKNVGTDEGQAGTCLLYTSDAADE